MEINCSAVALSDNEIVLIATLYTVEGRLSFAVTLLKPQIAAETISNAKIKTSKAGMFFFLAGKLGGLSFEEARTSSDVLVFKSEAPQ